MLFGTKMQLAAAIGFALLVRGAARAPDMTAPSYDVRLDSSDDSTRVVETVARFHSALASRDSLGVMALLAADAAIAESGEVQTRAEYHAHHLQADIEYSAAVPSVNKVTLVQVTGDAAWVMSTSITKGEFKGRAISSAGAELMVLGKSKGQWKIRAIHWSSRRVQ